MFSIKIRDARTKKQREFKVTFRHHQFDRPIPGVVNPVIGKTVCRVYVDGKRLATGVALCSVYDTYNKNVGRKVAMTDALKKFPRNIRRHFWKAYFSTRGRID